MFKVNVFKLALVLVCAIVILPRIPITQAGYGESLIRLDGLASAMLGALMLYIFRRSYVIVPMISLACLYIFQGSSSVSISFAYYLQVLSIVMMPKFYGEISKREYLFNVEFLENAKNILIYYAIANILIAVISRYLAFSFCLDSTNIGCVGEYGLHDRPYIFSVFVGVGFVLHCKDKNVSLLKLLILVYGLLISDSRSISAIMLVFGFGVFVGGSSFSKRNSIILLAGLTVAALMLIFGEGKITLSHMGQNDVDPSWMLRVSNIDNYMNWVDPIKAFSGNGAFAFYEFSAQYGLPGPMDILYFRVASEVGIIGMLVLGLLLFHPLWIAAKSNNQVFYFSLFVAVVASISIFQESLLIPRSGHILAYLIIFLIQNDKKSVGKCLVKKPMIALAR